MDITNISLMPLAVRHAIRSALDANPETPSSVQGLLSSISSVAGPKSFSGQVELTGQAAEDDNSAMTRALTDARIREWQAVGLGLDTTMVADWTGIFGYGQSLSTGANGVPVAHASPVYNHLTFHGGPFYPSGDRLLSTDPLHEVVDPVSTTIGESPCSAFAEGVTQRLTMGGHEDLTIFAATGGVGGLAIAGLVPGTAPYTHLVLMHNSASALAAAAGKTYKTSALWWLQGESDAANPDMTQSGYLAQLSTLVTAAHNDMGAITLTYQTVAYTKSNPAPALAQLQIDALPYCHFVTPIYFIPPATGTYGSNIHPGTNGYQEIGYRMARAWFELLCGQAVSHIQPLRVVQEGVARLTAYFSVPVAPLAWDTSRVPLAENYGFVVVDDSGPVSIDGITINGSSVTFVIGQALSGTVHLRYGIDAATSWWVNGAYGNLTDSTGETCWISGNQVQLKHWCPAFSQPALKLTGPNYPTAAGPELSAWEQWNLGTDSSSLVGAVHGHSLTPVATVTYNADAVVCPAGLGGYVNGLTAAFADRADYTFCMVFKRPVDNAGDLVFVGGTLRYVSEDGRGIFISGSDTTGPTIVDASLLSWAGKAVGDWVFAAFRSNGGLPGGMLGGGTFVEGTSVKTPAAVNVGIGNCRVAFSNCDNELQVSEFVLFDSALTEAEITAVYRRSRNRMAARGISI